MEIKTPPQFGIGGRKSYAEWTFYLMRLKEMFLLQKKTHVQSSRKNDK